MQGSEHPSCCDHIWFVNVFILFFFYLSCHFEQISALKAAMGMNSISMQRQDQNPFLNKENQSQAKKKKPKPSSSNKSSRSSKKNTPSSQPKARGLQVSQSANIMETAEQEQEEEEEDVGDISFSHCIKEAAAMAADEIALLKRAQIPTPRISDSARPIKTFGKGSRLQKAFSFDNFGAEVKAAATPGVRETRDWRERKKFDNNEEKVEEEEEEEEEEVSISCSSAKLTQSNVKKHDQSQSQAGSLNKQLNTSNLSVDVDLDDDYEAAYGSVRPLSTSDLPSMSFAAAMQMMNSTDKDCPKQKPNRNRSYSESNHNMGRKAPINFPPRQRKSPRVSLRSTPSPQFSSRDDDEEEEAARDLARVRLRPRSTSNSSSSSGSESMTKQVPCFECCFYSCVNDLLGLARKPFRLLLDLMRCSFLLSVEIYGFE